MNDVQFEKQIDGLNKELRKHYICGFYVLHNPNDKGSTGYFASFSANNLPRALQKMDLILTVHAAKYGQFDELIDKGLHAILDSITKKIDAAKGQS